MSDEQTSQATQEIFDWVKEQLGRKDVGTANRPSSAPQCVRKRWFQNKGIEGEPMQPRSLLVFATGDVVEHVLKFFIAKACVGPGKLYSEVDFGVKDGTFTIQHREFDIYRQEKVEIQMPGLTIVGSPDGWGKRNSDGEWELIEIKSSSSYGFDDFVRGECDYLKQATTLLMSDKAKALNAKSYRFYYMNKNTSAIFDRLYHFDEGLAAQVRLEFLATNGQSLPPIPTNDPDIGPQEELYRKKPTGRSKLGWKCGYCDYKDKCYANLKKEFSSTGKPVFYVETQKVSGDE